MEPKNSLQQLTWNYIRRNQAFRYGDILMIIQISDSALDRYLRHLCVVGYIERTTANTSSVKRSDSEYRVMTKLGILAPIINDKTYLYDPNTKLQYSLDTGEVVSNEEHGNQCLRYSLLLGKEYNFLASYKHRYKVAHPELISVEDWYEHAKNMIDRNDVLVKNLEYIKKFLGKKRSVYAFSRELIERDIFKNESSFSSGIKRITEDKERKLLHEDILKRYENSVEIFEELYGSIIPTKERS